MQYELSYIIKGDLEETKLKEVTQGLVGFIEAFGGEAKITNEPKTQPLAYPIKKQAQGLFGVVELRLKAKRLPELEKKLKESKEIIRFMITKAVSRRNNADKDVEKTLKRKESASNQFTPLDTKLSNRASRREISGQKKEEKAEIKELDKKLDEILKENI